MRRFNKNLKAIFVLIGMVIFTMPIFAINGTPPSAPSGLAKWGETQVGARIGFIDNSTNETGFKAYVSLYGSSENISVASMEAIVGTGEYQYKTLTGLSCATLYTVNVVAYNDDGESSKIHVDFRTKPCDPVIVDDPYMMPYYTGKILPTPRQVEYKDDNISLSNTAIILNNVEQNDTRLQYLTERISRYGGKYAFVTEANATEYTCIIKINDDTLNAPQKAQGYVIESNGNTISLKGNDFQGLLWAISSLNQMIFNESGEAFVNTFNISSDWPESLQRGFLAESEISKDPKVISHFMVAYKLNLVDFREEIAGDKEHHDNWRLPRTDTFKTRVKELGERLTPLGFEWYAGARFLGYGSIPQINISDENDTDFNIIYDNFAEPIAKAGGYLSVQFDDTRFPLHKDDNTTFGTAAEADEVFLNHLYDKLIITYPNIRIAFTPPFYWGPIAPNVYSESRDDYLNMVGTLPSAIDVYWTGPRVRSNEVLPEHVNWERDRIGRKPLIFQNGIGNPHAFDYHYVTDPIENLNRWYYNGYLQDIKTYMLNGGDFDKSGALVSIADWTWNPTQFDANLTIEDAVKKLTGVEAYPILQNINTKLSTFDKYLGDITLDAILKLNDFNATLNNLKTLNSQLNSLNNGKSIEFWTDINASHIERIRKFVNQISNASKDSIVQQIIDRDDASIAMYFAIKDMAEEADINYDLNADILIKPTDFNGSQVGTYGYYDAEAGIHLDDRPTSYITGQGTGYSEMNATFDLAELPLSGSVHQLIISGADDFLEAKCPIKITFNNTVIFEGANPFSNKKWNIQTAGILADKFKLKNNVLSISNTSSESNFDAPPAFMLNYAILRDLK